MLDELLAQELWVRLGAFLGVLALMTTLETVWPCRPRTRLRSERWPANLAMVVVDSAVVRALFPTAAVGIVWWAQGQGLGTVSLAGCAGLAGAAGAAVQGAAGRKPIRPGPTRRLTGRSRTVRGQSPLLQTGSTYIEGL